MSLRRGVVVLALALLTAGCGGSSGGSTAASSPAPSPSPSVDSSAAAQAAITAGWQTFFTAGGTPDSHIALLEDGEKFRKELTASAADPANRYLVAHVTAVTVKGTTADVTYDLLGKGGAVLLGGSTGQAVQVGGKWLVSKATYCSLITLQDSTVPHPGCA